MRKLSLTIVVLFLLLTACQTPPQDSFTEGDRELIRTTAADAVKAFKESKDLNAYVAGYYAENARVLLPNNETVEGRPAIIELLKSFGEFNIDFKINEINGSNGLAYVYGNYELEMKTMGIKDRGKYMEVWKKQSDGTWRAVYDISNTSIPLPIDAE